MDEKAAEEQEIEIKDINHLFKELKYHSSTFDFKLNSFTMRLFF